MALTLEQQTSLAGDSGFVNRVRMAMAQVAFDVLGEDQSAMDADVAIARVGLAQQLLRNPQATALRAAQVLAAQIPEALPSFNTPDPSGITDAGYVSFIANNWTKLAGVNPSTPGAT